MHKLKSLAKLNLYLHVTGKKDNGYHLLDSMVMFAENLYDEIAIKESSKTSIKTTGPWSNRIDSDNILSLVVEKFSQIRPIPSFEIILTKNIPVGAGLGGGSGNAASLLKFLVQKYYPDMEEQEIINLCLRIGADVPSCYHSQKLYFNGIGEIITPIENAPTIYAVILFPNISIKTKDIFGRQNSIFKDNLNHKLSFQSSEEMWQYLEKTDNDLFNNAEDLHPKITNILKKISSTKRCKIARMSGSGSACFGLFESHKDALEGANSLQTNFTSYSIYVTKLK